MKTKIRNLGFTLQAQLVSEAAAFLKKHYQTVPDLVSGSLFPIANFVINLLRREEMEENYGELRAQYRYFRTLSEYPFITADLFSHLIQYCEDIPFLVKTLRENHTISVNRGGKEVPLSLHIAKDEEIAAFV